MSKSPDEILSERIIADLKSKSLLSEKELEKLAKVYVNGQVSAEDWVLHIESSLKKENENVKKN
ncbi:MAG: hypothetical protein ABSD46_03095 [Bacteroidota bacterium]